MIGISRESDGGIPPAIRHGANLSQLELTDSHRVVVIDAAGKTIHNTSLAALSQYFGVGGGGSGGSGLIAPSMPDSQTFIVPKARPNGAIVGYVAPLTVGSPSPTYAMTPVTGLACRPDTGDIYITNASAFLTALASGNLTTALTATNEVDFDSTDVTFTIGPDYDDLEQFNANAVHDWDVLDNRQVRYDPVLNVVTLISDKSPEQRHATNDRDKLSYALNSALGNGKPAMRGNGASGPTSGMYFYQNPIWKGVRNISLSGTTVDRVTLLFDQMHYISGVEDALNRIWIDFTKNDLIGKPILLTLIWNGANLKVRVNGTDYIKDVTLSPVRFRPIVAGETPTPITLDSYNQADNPGMAFVLFQATTCTGAILATSAIGQLRNWRGGAFNGDICRIVSYLNTVEV
jgi:hypothetical protein